MAYESPNSDLIEPRFKDSIDRYVEHGCPTGSFLEAVLKNNLKEAFGRADHEAMDNLRHIVAYCYNEIPAPCWGSEEKVNEWYKLKNKTTEMNLTWEEKPID